MSKGEGQDWIEYEWLCQKFGKIEARNGKPHLELTWEELKICRKYIGKLNWLASNTRLDISDYVMNCTRSQKKATLKDLRDHNRIFVKVHKKIIE